MTSEGRPPYQDPETLRRLYYDEGLTQAEIADELGYARRTVSDWMSIHDIAPGGSVLTSSLTRSLEQMDPEDVGKAKPEGDDD